MRYKQIEGFTGYYVSEAGFIYSTRTSSRDKNKVGPIHLLKPRLTKNGYERVYLRNDVTNKRKDYYIHHLVANAFIPNPNNLKYINHIDCIRNNNNVNNLEWCNVKYNANYTLNNNHLIRDPITGKFIGNYNYIPVKKELYDMCTII